MMSRSAMFSQTTPTLILPTEMKGTAQLNIRTLPNLSAEPFGYEVLSVFVQQEGEELGSNPVQGRHFLEGEYLVFSPYFPWERGLTYVVVTKQADAEGPYAYRSFQVGKKQTVEKAEVVTIYPSASELPENLLRFYLYFNTPMKKGEALAHIRLTDAEGNIDRRAFMEFKQELWSPDGKRLTLLFDPGRIKRGVSTNRELGPALLEGNQYHLIISSAWQDVYGQPLSGKTTKVFVAVEAYRQHLEANGLAIGKPAANSFDPLSIHFDRVMDHALVQSMIQVEDQERKLIAGQWTVLEQEQLIQFTPEKSWQSGTYRIVLDSRLEDVAGNNLHSPLDHIELDGKHSMIGAHQTIDFTLSGNDSGYRIGRR